MNISGNSVSLPPISYTALTLGRINKVMHDPLTSRELQVLSLWLLGLTMSGIGQLLSISHRTVESHLGHVREKLHVQSRFELLKLLLRLELFDDLFQLAKLLFGQSTPRINRGA